MEMEPEEETLLSRAERSFLGPLVYNIIVLAMNIGFAVAFLSAVYLIYGLFSGNLSDYSTLAQGDRARILSNLRLATQAMTAGLGVGSLAAAYVFWGEEFVGYGMLVGGMLIGLGIPQIYTMVGGGQASTKATALALGAFPGAMMAPLVIGGVLVARDVVYRLIRGFQEKPVRVEKMTYGTGAAAESRPIRTSLLAKCWEGPYCREFIRVHCPIFQKRQACWREKRGCYCEEDIVSTAASKVSGIALEMAPDPKLNFANPPSPAAAANDPLNRAPGLQLGTLGGSPGGRVEGGIGAGLGGGLNFGAPPPRKVTLSMSQKKERCRNCVIYNEHQREKYKLLMPVTLLGTLAFCAVFATPLRQGINAATTAIDRLLGQISFNPAGAAPAVNLGQPSETVAWFLVVALSIMIVSKALQMLEWAIFKIKI